MGGEEVSKQYPKKLGYEVKVSLIDTSLGLQHQIGSLTIDRKVLCNPTLSCISQLWLTLEPAIFNQLPPIVELGDERCPGGINICAIDIPADNRQENVNPLATDSDVSQWSMFSMGCPPV